MAINFPSSPTVGQIFTSGTKSWEWNGTAWVANTSASGGQYFGAATVKTIAYNANTISENLTVTATNNGLSAGPVTIASGYAVTIENGATWSII